MAVASCAPAFAADDWSLKTGDSSFYTYDTRQVTPVQDLKVNVATGNLVIHARDVDVTGGLMPFSLDRYYNSQAQWSSNLGPHWDLGPLALRVRGMADGSEVVYLPSGVVVRFVKDSDGHWSAAPHFNVALDENPAQHFTVTLLDQDLAFDVVGAVGQTRSATAVRRSSGRHLNFVQDGSGRVVQLAQADSTASSHPNDLLFSYTPGPGISVAYNEGNTSNIVRATYGNGSPANSLVVATGTLSNQTSFSITYSYTATADPQNPRLTGIKRVTSTGLTQNWTIGYDTAGRVSTIADASGTTTFTYMSGYTIVRRPAGRTAYFFDADGHVWATQVGNPPGASATGELADLHDQALDNTDPAGVTVSGIDVDGLASLGVSVDGATVASAPASGAVTATADLTVDPQALSEGRHAIRATATGTDGEVGTSPAWNVFVDHTPPAAVSGLRADFDQARGKAQLSWAATTDPALSDGSAGSGVDHYEWRIVQLDGTWSTWADADLDAFVSRSPGDHVTLQVRAVDVSSNVGPVTQAAVTVGPGPAPVPDPAFESCGDIPTSGVPYNTSCYANGGAGTATAGWAGTATAPGAAPLATSGIVPSLRSCTAADDTDLRRPYAQLKAQNYAWSFDGSVLLNIPLTEPDPAWPKGVRIINKVHESLSVRFNGRLAVATARSDLLCGDYLDKILLAVEARWRDSAGVWHRADRQSDKSTDNPTAGWSTGLYFRLHRTYYQFRFAYTYNTSFWGDRRPFPLPTTNVVKCVGHGDDSRCVLDPNQRGWPPTS